MFFKYLPEHHQIFFKCAVNFQKQHADLDRTEFLQTKHVYFNVKSFVIQLKTLCLHLNLYFKWLFLKINTQMLARDDNSNKQRNKGWQIQACCLYEYRKLHSGEQLEPQK